jgi:hypothetical protein
MGLFFVAEGLVFVRLRTRLSYLHRTDVVIVGIAAYCRDSESIVGTGRGNSNTEQPLSSESGNFFVHMLCASRSQKQFGGFPHAELRRERVARPNWRATFLVQRLLLPAGDFGR